LARAGPLPQSLTGLRHSVVAVYTTAKPKESTTSRGWEWGRPPASSEQLALTVRQLTPKPMEQRGMSPALGDGRFVNTTPVWVPRQVGQADPRSLIGLAGPT